MAAKSVNDYHILLTAPEEGAGMAWDFVKGHALKTLGIEVKDASMSLEDRILTNGEIVKSSIAKIRGDEDAAYGKGPGITPTREQIINAIVALEKANKLIFRDCADKDALNQRTQELRQQFRPATGWTQEAFEALANQMLSEPLFAKIAAIGSPNASWRDETGTNLYRGATKAMTENSTAVAPIVNQDTPLTVSAFKSEMAQNIETVRTKESSKVTFLFVDEDGAEKELKKVNISEGSAIRAVTHNEQEIKGWCKKALEENPDAKIAHGTKQTVLKGTNNKLIKWMMDVVTDLKRETSIAPFAKFKDKKTNKVHDKFGGLLVDDLQARLYDSPPKEPLLVMVPDASYSDYIKDLWDEIKNNGGLRAPQNGEIARASATNDHYSAIEFEATKKGRVIAKDADGNIILSKNVEAGEVGMFTFFDRERVESYVNETLKRASETGKNTVLFGFEPNSEYYAVAYEALKKYKDNYPTVNVEVGSPAKLTARYFTGGGDNAILCLNNIHGDFATDIEPTGKGTSYSVGPIPNSGGRIAVELGTGGTAPDLLDAAKEEGYLKFNPMAFIEATAMKLANIATLMKNGGFTAEGENMKKTADALNEALFATTRQGIVVPIIKGKFKKDANVENYTEVGTEAFVAAINHNMLKIMREKGINIAGNPVTVKQVADAEYEAAKLIALEKALVEASKNDGFKANTKTINERLVANGTVDPLHPDYSIRFPLQMLGVEKIGQRITPENMIKFQELRLAHVNANSTGRIRTKQALQKHLMGKCGVIESVANWFVLNDPALKTTGIAMAA